MIEEAFSISSDGLALEARLNYLERTVEPKAAALICPPHPFLGGDMENNVICAVANALGNADIPVMRFNYRGIGASECGRDLAVDLELFWDDSTCPDYEAEILVDSNNAYRHLEKVLPNPLPFYVIGYSFGAIPALRIAASNRVAGLCLISPPLAKWQLPALPRDVRCGLYYAPGDFACPEEKINSLFEALPEPKLLSAFDDTDHFFVGRENDLADAVCEFLQT